VASWKDIWLSTHSFPQSDLHKVVFAAVLLRFFGKYPAMGVRHPLPLECHGLVDQIGWLACSVYNPNAFSLASYGCLFNPFVALCWIRSRHSVSFFKCGDHTCTQYSSRDAVWCKSCKVHWSLPSWSLWNAFWSCQELTGLFSLLGHSAYGTSDHLWRWLQDPFLQLLVPVLSSFPLPSWCTSFISCPMCITLHFVGLNVLVAE